MHASKTRSPRRSAVFAGAAETPAGVDLANSLMGEIASLIAAPASTLNFGDAAVISTILHRVETSSGLTLTGMCGVTAR